MLDVNDCQLHRSLPRFISAFRILRALNIQAAITNYIVVCLVFFFFSSFTLSNLISPPFRLLVHTFLPSTGRVVNSQWLDSACVDISSAWSKSPTGIYKPVLCRMHLLCLMPTYVRRNRMLQSSDFWLHLQITIVRGQY